MEIPPELIDRVIYFNNQITGLLFFGVQGDLVQGFRYLYYLILCYCEVSVKGLEIVLLNGIKPGYPTCQLPFDDIIKMSDQGSNIDPQFNFTEPAEIAGKY